MKAPVKHYLSITKKEWNGMVVLIVLIIMVGVTPYIYQLFGKDNTINVNDFDKEVALLGKMGYRQTNMEVKHVANDKKLGDPVMFPFNPNGLSEAQWIQLGLSAHQAEIIKHYEAKGGRFYSKVDLKKIYTLTVDDYKRLEPYVNIPADDYAYKKLKANEVIELNNADSAKLTGLNGIGGGFAVRIVRYRGRLGGFINKEQLKEVYGIDSLKYVAIKDNVSVNPNRIKKIDINTISFDQLRLFPYLTYKQGNAIIQYRVQHGNYASMADMKNIAILDDGILRKIEPYLNFK